MFIYALALAKNALWSRPVRLTVSVRCVFQPKRPYCHLSVAMQTIRSDTQLDNTNVTDIQTCEVGE
jgi:hypothetical protein